MKTYALLTEAKSRGKVCKDTAFPRATSKEENRQVFLMSAKQSINCKEMPSPKNLGFNLILTIQPVFIQLCSLMKCSITHLLSTLHWDKQNVHFTDSCKRVWQSLALGDGHQMYLPWQQVSQYVQCHWLQEKSSKSPGSIPSGSRLDRNSSIPSVSNKNFRV